MSQSLPIEKILSGLSPEVLARLASEKADRVLRPPTDHDDLRAAVGRAPEEWTPRQVEDLLGDIRIKTYVTGTDDDVKVETEMDSRDVKDLTRQVMEPLSELAASLNAAKEDLDAQFVGSLSEAMTLSVQWGLVSHPEMRIDEWIEKIKEYGLEDRARELLLKNGNPEDYAVWKDHLLPFSERWDKIWLAWKDLVRGHQFKQAKVWSDAVLKVIPETLMGFRTPEARKGVRQPSVESFRASELQRFWGTLQAKAVVARQEGKPWAASLQETANCLKDQVIPHISLLDWSHLWGESEECPPSPSSLRERFSIAISLFQDQVSAWMEDSQTAEFPPPPVGSNLARRGFAPGSPLSWNMSTIKEWMRNLQAAPTGMPASGVQALLNNMDSLVSKESNYASLWDVFRLALLDSHLPMSANNEKRPRF